MTRKAEKSEHIEKLEPLAVAQRAVYDKLYPPGSTKPGKISLVAAEVNAAFNWTDAHIAEACLGATHRNVGRFVHPKKGEVPEQVPVPMPAAADYNLKPLGDLTLFDIQSLQHEAERIEEAYREKGAMWSRVEGAFRLRCRDRGLDVATAKLSDGLNTDEIGVLLGAAA